MSMNAYLATPAGEHTDLDREAVTIGRNDGSDVVLSDPRVSGLHAIIHHYRGGWSVQDLSSLNGTFLNGQRVLGERQLRPGDELGIGGSRLVFRADTGFVPGKTDPVEEPPEVTAAELDVLKELCRPLAANEPFPQPASVEEIARVRVVGEETVKWHLKNLYRKFDIGDAPGSRRFQLANEAIHQGVVSLADLRLGRR